MGQKIEKQIYFGSKDELEQLDKSKEIYFSDCFNFEKTYSYPRDYEVNFSNLYHVHYGDIHTKFPNTITKDIILPYIKNDKQHYVTLLPGDIVVADASEDHKDLGKSVLFEDTERTVIAGLHTHFLRNNNNIIDSKYYLYFTKTDKYIKEMRRLGTGISVLGISKTNLNKIKIPYESLENQLKIAATLSQIDNLINLKCMSTSKLKSTANYIRNNMILSADSKSTRLSDVATVTGGYAFKSLDMVEQQNENKILRIGDIKPSISESDFTGKYYYSDNLNNLPIASMNEIVIALSGATFGKVGIVQDGKFLLNQRTAVITSINQQIFINQLLQTDHFKNYIQSIPSASAQPNISTTDLELYSFTPSDNYYKTSILLSQMDKLIEIEEKKLIQLEKLKKYHLQQFFN